MCVPSCLPSWCFRNTQYGASWRCSLDCAGECYEWPEPSGPPTHTITDLRSMTDLYWFEAINNDGDLVGKTLGSDGLAHAALWADGELVNLGRPGVSSEAVDVNNHPNRPKRSLSP